jgi:hypothetical protein
MMANTSILSRAIGSVMGTGLVFILSAGATPLELALASSQKDVASLLKQHGAVKPRASRAGQAGPARTGKAKLALTTIVLLNPDAQLKERLTDPGALTEYMITLMEAAGEALAGGPYKDARGLVVAVGIKPGNKVKIWCDAVEGLMPQEELRKLESVLMKVPAIKVKNGPVAFLLGDDAWPHRGGSPKLPAAWIEAMAAAKKKSITLPDELFKLIWKK